MVARIKARRAAQAQAQAEAQAALPKSGNDHLNLSQAPTEPEVYREPFPESLPDDWGPTDQEIEDSVARVKARREKEALPAMPPTREVEGNLKFRPVTEEYRID